MNSRQRVLRPILFTKSAFFLCLLLLQSGCAVHYYDPATETEHLWGFGHMKMRIVEPSEGLEAVVHGTDVLGVSLGKTIEHSYFTVGWHRVEFIDIRKESTAFRLERPGMGFGNVRVGYNFPLLTPTPDEIPPGASSLDKKEKESE